VRAWQQQESSGFFFGLPQWTAAVACGYAGRTKISIEPSGGYFVALFSLETLGLDQCVDGAAQASAGFLPWIESTGLAECVRSSTPGYPSMIALHAVGMAIMVGLSLLIDLRVLGWFAGIPLQALQRFFRLAWIGFGINFISGSALFTAQATMYIVDWVFMTKMTLVVLGAITAAILQPAIAKAGPGAELSGGIKAVAGLAIVFWVVAIIMGRLTAYL
jgi:hypothetical protein